jgi:hypothetical protein
MGQSAHEVRRLVDTACAVVASDLRVGAEWPRAIDFALGAVCSDDARRSFSLLDPPLNEADLVERVGTVFARVTSVDFVLDGLIGPSSDGKRTPA